MTLLLLFCITLTFTVTAQNETVAIINDLLEAIRRISDSKDVIILPMEESPIVTNDTVVPNDNMTYYNETGTDPIVTYNTVIPNDNKTYYNESQTDNENGDFEDLRYFIEQDNMQLPKNKNILRWLPKRKKKSKAAKRQEERATANAIKERNAQHAKRVSYVVSVIKDKHYAASYMYNEIRRIQKDRRIVDDIRVIILNIEGKLPGQRTSLTKAILECYKVSKATYMRSHHSVWTKPNS